MEAKKRQINEQVVNKHDFCFVFMRSVDVKFQKNQGLEGGKRVLRNCIKNIKINSLLL